MVPEASVAWLLDHELPVRVAAFAGVLALMAGWEALAPRRERALSRARRWTGTLGIVLLNSALVRLALPGAAVGFAAMAEQRGWGLLNQYDLPFPLAFIAGVAALDLVIYLQHVMFHAVPALWRLHRMHHADLDFDVTTGARFHPVEILLSMLVKLAAIAALGPSAVAVLAFEVLLNASSMFNHANLRLPAAVDRLLRLLVVTPDMRRVHHSVEPSETNSNFGFNLSLWDRLFRTYKAQPDAGHEGMTLGIAELRAPKIVADLPGMLVLPFLGEEGRYAINRRPWERGP